MKSPWRKLALATITLAAFTLAEKSAAQTPGPDDSKTSESTSTTPASPPASEPPAAPSQGSSNTATPSLPPTTTTPQSPNLSPSSPPPPANGSAQSSGTGSATPAPLAPTAPAPAPIPSLGGSTWQMVAYLGGMLALFALGAWFLRNGMPALNRGKSERKLQISETRSLGSRQFLVVAQYEGRKMLIGVCPGRIDYLCTLQEPDSSFPPISPEKPE